jgi:hypothetical protein
LGNFLGEKKEHSGNGDRLGTRPAAEALLGPIIKRKIHSELTKTLAEEFQFHSVSVPTKVRAKKGANGKEMEVLEAGSLLPVEVKSQNGWLAVGSTFCTQSQRALGVSFSAPGVIQSIDNMSPAAMAGFKPGDRIETFSEPSGRSKAFGGTYDPFLNFIKDKAAHIIAKDRKVIVSGKDSQGNSFSRTVFLCPSQLNHKEQAQKGFAQFKSAK